jgi:DNA-binding transcriptional MerR regulator
MIRIGDFSKLSRVSIKALRFYDEMNLLKPIFVDRFSGYRFYEYNQLPRLHRILALKDLGFSLEEIRQMLSAELSAEQIRGMLKLRQVEIRQKVREEAERLDRVDVLLKHIEKEDIMSKYDVVIRKVEPIKVASVRAVVPTPPDQGSLWGELESWLAGQRVRPAGACLSLYHDDEFKERDWDIEVCEPVSVDFVPGKRVQARELPLVETMACTLHHGSLATISEAYNAIGKWIEANGYRTCGPCREVYLREAKPVGSRESGAVDQDDPETVVEIHFPVEKV